MSWIGGKKALRELIVSLFPVYYERYIEVFGGGGWVLFHKPPGNDFEVYNDFNGLLVNLYRCVREKPEELMEALRFVLNAREDFDAVRAALARDSPASDVQRAAWFYQLIRYSYASGLTSFGSQPHDREKCISRREHDWQDEAKLCKGEDRNKAPDPHNADVPQLPQPQRGLGFQIVRVNIQAHTSTDHIITIEKPEDSSSKSSVNGSSSEIC